MKKQLICICMAALLSLSLLTGCGAGTDTGDTAGTETKNVTVRLSEVTHSVFYAPQYVAMSQGFFADEGLDIELSNGGGADKVMTAVVSGGADIGLAGPESCIYIHAQGKDDLPVIFAQLTKRDGSFLVGRSDEAFDWNDLKGKTIIGGRKGGVPEMTLEYVLKQHGIVPQEDAVVDTSVQFNMMAGAFTGGQGDYVTLFEPTATEVERAGHGYILCSIGEESGEIPYTAYFASQSYMTAHPEVIQGFANAIARAQQWIVDHTDREVAEAIIDQFPDTDLDTLEAVTARHRQIDAWNAGPMMARSALERLETVMTEAGELARALHAPVFAHNAETAREVAECQARWGKTPTELFASLGHFDYGGGGFHCVHMTEHDLEIFRDRGLWAVTNPGSNAKLASGIAPLKQMRALGIHMAIGTDGPSSNNALDFFREMYLAAVLQKLRCGDAAALPADDVLHMATVGGAQAMGLTDCDVLAPGKQADLIVIDLQRPNMQPVHNAARNLVYSGSKENVRLTMVAGRVLYENGAFFVGEPVQDIYRAVDTAFAAMRAAL